MTVGPNIYLDNARVTRPGGVQLDLNWRLRGRFNVKEYGAKGNGTADDHDAIQTCIDAAADYSYVDSSGNPTSSANIVFPPGIYNISKTLIPRTTGQMVFRGCGANTKALMGSIIRGNFHGFLMYTGHNAYGGKCIGLVRDLGFINSFDYSPRTTDPPIASIPDPVTVPIQGASRAGVSNVIRLGYALDSGTFADQDCFERLKNGAGGPFPVTLFVSGVSGMSSGIFTITTYGPTVGIASISSGSGGTTTLITLTGGISLFRAGDYVRVSNTGTNANGKWTVSTVNTGASQIEIPVSYGGVLSPPSGSTPLVENFYVELPGTTWSSGMGGGGTLQWAADGCGCVYDSGVSAVYENCDFRVGNPASGQGGCGLVIVGFKILVRNSIFTGPYAAPDTSANAHRKSVGLAIRDGTVDNCYFSNFGTGIWGFRGGFGARNCIIEHCNHGTNGGNPYGPPYDFLEMDNNTIQPRDLGYIGAVSLQACHVRDCTVRLAFGSSGFGLQSSIGTVSPGAPWGVPKQGFGSGGTGGATWECSAVSGQFLLQGMGFNNDGEGGTSVEATVYENLRSDITSGTAGRYTYSAPLHVNEPHSYFRSIVGFAGKFNQFSAQFSAQNTMMSATTVCIDSLDPIWTAGGKSNAGKPLAPTPGTPDGNEVLVRWNNAIAAWVLAG